MPTSLLFFLSMFRPPHSIVSLSVPRSFRSLRALDNPFPTAASCIAPSATASSSSSMAGSLFSVSSTSVQPQSSVIAASGEFGATSSMKTSLASGFFAFKTPGMPYFASQPQLSPFPPLGLAMSYHSEYQDPQHPVQ
nr:hypothetical protein Iba_chr11fCG10650 [Ipomoea batatas]